MTTLIPQRKYFDTENKVFLEKQMYVDNFGSVYGFRGEFHSGCLEIFHYVIEVPFTGLLDKDKKPLYAKDIVKLNNNGAEDYGTDLFIVTKDEWGEWRLYDSANNGFKLYIFDYQDVVELIGSALTNPELLEGKE